jgi:hypothetical protein
MGWANALRYAKAAWSGGHDGGEAVADAGLPLGARLGSVVAIQAAPFLRASAAGGLIQDFPPGAQIVAISRLKVPMSGKVYRYYLTKADDLTAKESFLQFYLNPEGAVVDACYCKHLTRLYPTTADEQVAFTGEAGHGLGDLRFTLSREELAAAGLPEAQLTSALAGAEQLTYEREGGSPDAEFVAPYQGTEVRVDDRAGEGGLTQLIWFMPYARALADGSIERLLISTEVVQSIDGNANRRSVHVDFMICIPLERERITIQ